VAEKLGRVGADDARLPPAPFRSPRAPSAQLPKADDGRLFDGFLIDDAGGGLWLPVLKVDDKDTLFVGEDKLRFVPQIDLTHQLYAGDSNDFLLKKRANAKILKDKGLGDKHRMYEIKGVSHFDAGQTQLADLVPQTLDLGALMASFLDLLDRWVETGEAPPATRSDLLELGDANEDKVNANLPLRFRSRLSAWNPLRLSGRPRHLAPGLSGDRLRRLRRDQSRADRRARPVRRHERQWHPRQARDHDASLGEARAAQAGRAADAWQYVACIASTAAKPWTRLLPPRMLPYYVNRAAASGVGETGR
jgi:hypothetical protein